MGRILVTGGTGFLGSHMCRYLASQGEEVVATFTANRPRPVDAHADGIEYRPLEITDRAMVTRLVEETKPDVVYHFAGQAFVIQSWADPLNTFAVNLTGTLHLLEALRYTRPRTRLAFAGSGTEYGEPDQIPTPEGSPLRPTSPYAASKAAADLLCYQYFRSFGIPVFRFRIFGTTGPGKRGDSTNDFASQIVACERASPPHVIRVGNLDKRRDVADVRDAVRAMITAVEKGQPGEAYNIASGEAKMVREILNTLCSMAKSPITVDTDPAKLRLVDEPVHLADVSKLRALGWAPQVPFRQTLSDILESWRSAGAP
jgi:GDP-4-dehydro-6-deoxy-D-mannose reductase